MEKFYHFDLDFSCDDSTAPVTVCVKQYDQFTRYLIVSLFNSGERYTIGTGVTARFQMTKPDGTTVINDALITNNTVMVELTAQALAAEGVAVAEIALYQSSEVLSSQTFHIKIVKAAYDEESLISSDEYGALVTVINAASAAVTAANAAVTSANSAAAAATAAAEGADEAKTAANTAATAANNAAGRAETATASANSAATAAETATDNAESATNAANAAATAANNAAAAATSAKDNANSAAATAYGSAGQASTAATAANTAAASANEAATSANSAATAATTAKNNADSAAATAATAAGRAENAYTAATNAASAANTAAAGAAHVDISAEQTATGATITVTDRDGVETEVHIDTLTAITTWNDVRNAVRLGLGAQLFPPGYEFEVACPNRNYTVPFVVRGHDTILAKNNKLTHTMILECKYVYGHNGAAYSAVQFDAPEALYYAENGLTAGTYHFNWNDSNGLSVGDYQFTLASGIPPHGQITINTSAQTVTTYASVGATTAIESNVQLSQGTDGTDLGATGSGNLNHVHRILWGNNNYAQSAARQLINSAEAAGDVWAPVSKFDRPPSWATSLEGFAYVLDPEFLAVVETAAIPCRTSNVFEAASLDGTQFATASTYTLYDKFFLLSRPEIFGDWDSASIKDGVQLEYYVGLSNAERIRRDKNGSARDCFLRSPFPGNAGFVRNLASGGSLGSYGAYGSSGVAPACIIA